MSRPAPAGGPPPPVDALRAFGVRDAPVLLDGGQRRTWRAGDVVLKPVDEPQEHAWLCETYDAWPARDTVRVPEPLRAGDGTWSADGWAAHRWLPGRTVRCGGDPAAFRRTVDAFHDVTADLARPAFLDHRDDAWSFGDRVAWDGEPPQGTPEVLDLLDEALAALRPVPSPAQVVHGDIGGNVLREPGLPDAVIDWPPYHRPPGLALAVAAGDAVAWEGAPESFLETWADVPDWGQLVLRAVVARIATRGRHDALGVAPPQDDYVAARRPSVEMALRLVARVG